MSSCFINNNDKSGLRRINISNDIIVGFKHIYLIEKKLKGKREHRGIKIKIPWGKSYYFEAKKKRIKDSITEVQ